MNRHASMNRIYRLVWSAVRGVWIPAAENSRGQGKRVTRTLVAATLALGAAYAQAGAPTGSTAGGPSGGVVTAGSGSITHSATLTTITQASPQLSLTWNSFNIPAQDTVDFVQPSASAIAVNRILDVNGTQILGHLNANGQVWLINPNGIVFGSGAEVNVGGLVASTLALDAASLPGDAQSFSGDGAGSVINQGTIHAAPGGYAALLGQHVGNSGVISAQLGTVALGAGSAATLKFKDTHLVSMQIDQSVFRSIADNGGLIRADGGQVLMSAGAEKALLASVVNNTGVIEARTLDHQEGSIILRGGMVAGTVNVAGTLDASAPGGGDGGAIETSAAHVEIANSAHVTTAAAMGLAGSWLIDPTDFTIAASGGDESGATLSAALANGNVAIASSGGAAGTSGDINVYDVVTWSAHLLTLTAVNNININAVMTANNTASLDLEPGSGLVNVGINAAGGFKGQVNFLQADAITPRGGTGFLTIAGLPYTVITTLGADGSMTGTDLQGINGAPAGNFALGANINASATASFAQGFTPIAGFTGNFNGLGHTISDLTLLPAAFTNNVGLFGQTALSSTIRNVGLIGETVTACESCNSTGGLVGFNYGAISNSFTTGAMTQSGYGQSIGGLVGRNYGSIDRSHSSMSVTVGDYGTNFGGLVGLDTGAINNSYASGNFYANAPHGGVQYVGGLVGHIQDTSASISNSYATGAVTVVGYGTQVGGLLGYNDGGTVSRCYATGAVTGNTYVGGLIGQILGRTDNFGNVDNSYATGSVTGSQRVGGLVGGAYGYLATNNSANISNSYSTGSVTLTGQGPVGGLVGAEVPSTGTNSAVTTNSFWDVTKSGQATSAGGIGLTTAQMHDQANFNSATVANGGVNPGWDFGATWVMYSGYTNPLLQAFMTPLTVITTIAQTYDGAAFAPTIGNLAYSITPDFSHLFGTLTVTGTAVGAIHPGSYSYTPGGLYSDQQGYIIAPYVTGTLTISPAPLTVTGTTPASKVYDGTTTAALAGGTLVGVLGGDTVTLAQTGTYASKHAGTGIAVTVTDSLGGASDGDYVLVEPVGVTGTITPASLTVSGTVVGTKIYNGNSSAPLLDGTLSGVIPGDSVTLVQAGNFASTNVGSGIAVTAADTLTGPSALNYSIIEPSGLSGSISPASSGNTPGTPGTSGGSGTSAGTSSPLLAAYYASAQVDANFVAPQWGATPQVVDASPSIDVVATASEPASTDAGDDQNSASPSKRGGVVINVAMKIGATGSLKIVSGGLRLPVTHIQGNPE
jgi:filamentous hemagglutinin family protein